MCLFHLKSWLLVVTLLVRSMLSHLHASLLDQYLLVLGKQLADPGTVDEAGALRLCTVSFASEAHTRWHVRVFLHLHGSPSPACQVHHLSSPREGWDTDARHCIRWLFPSLELESDDMSAKMRQTVGERERARVTEREVWVEGFGFN